MRQYGVTTRAEEVQDQRTPGSGWRAYMYVVMMCGRGQDGDNVRLCNGREFRREGRRGEGRTRKNPSSKSTRKAEGRDEMPATNHKLEVHMRGT